MRLSVRGLPYEVPQYSLTGDIVAHYRCGLQYRYYNRSSLPPSRPVQLWTGEFVHGVMEEAFLYWQVNQTPFPWPNNPTPWPNDPNLPPRVTYDIGELGDRVEARLKAAGKLPRDTDARNAAYRRVEAALRLLAPMLFPLISTVEEKVSATRPMPVLQNAIQGQQSRGDRYELVGRVDVISSVTLSKHASNPLVQMILASSSNLTSENEFEIIMDYKAARRPPTQASANPNSNRSHWAHEAMQVQMYAWMRTQQPQTIPVRAGLLIYVDELSPSASELKVLQDEMLTGRTDVMPVRGTQDYYALSRWSGVNPVPTLTEDFLLRRAIRMVPVDSNSIANALTNIDQSVSQIEACVMSENATGDIPNNWPTTGDDQDCDACDFRRFCPSPASVRNNSGKGHLNRKINTPG